MDEIHECFGNKKSDIQVRYMRGDGDVLTFGWNDPLKFNNEVVQNGEDYPRYQNDFASVPWGSKTFNITRNEEYLFMDVENLIIQQT